MTKTSEQIAQFIKERRQHLGMSQADVAYHIYGTESLQDYVSKIENGKKQMTIQTLDKFLEVLKCKLDFVEE